MISIHINKLTCTLFLLLLTLDFNHTASAQVIEKPQPLWPVDRVPDAAPEPPETAVPQPMNPNSHRAGPPNIKVSNVTVPTMTIYHPAAALDQHVAVLVFPGGGYQFMSYNMEGSEICDWLNTLGVTGVLVKYRTPTPPGGTYGKLPMEDGQRAIRLVRAHAAEMHIDPAHVGVIGFSAGANLSARMSTHAERTYPSIDAVDTQPVRPDFAMLIYPGQLIQEGTDRLMSGFPVDNATSPAFLVQAENDALIHNSVAYFLALQAAKVPAELHVYSEGGHGFGMRASPYPVSHWTDLAAAWLRASKIISH